MNKVFSIFLLCILSSLKTFGQLPPIIQFDLDSEYKHRKMIDQKEEKYHKNGKLDSVYRCWNTTTGHKLTEGYYIEGKRHGEWIEWLSYNTPHNHYLIFNYKYGRLKKMYEYFGRINMQKDSVKNWERFYAFKATTKDFSVHEINWDIKYLGKKTEEKLSIIKDNVHVESRKRKVWDKGIPWKQEWTVKQYNKNGKSLGHKKHGHWKLWNEDGTLQKETWYDMGKMLQQKLYEHGKLVSDKKY